MFKKRFLAVIFGFILLSPIIIRSSKAGPNLNVLDLSYSEKSNDVIAREKTCEECHQNIYTTILNNPGKHSQIVLRECKKCHLARKNTRGTRLLRTNEWRQIDLSGYTNEFLVTLNNLSSDKTYKLFATAWDKSGRLKKSEIVRFTPSGISEFLTDDGSAPKLKSSEVIQVAVGAIVSAQLKIESDKLVKVKIDYGTSEKLGLVLAVEQFRREHTLTLRALDIKKIYYYKVTVVDSFDNKVTSEKFNFSPSKSFQKTSAGDEIIDEFILHPVKVLKFVKRDEYASKSNMDNSLRQKNAIAVIVSANMGMRAAINFTEVDLEKENEDKKDKKHGEFGLKSRRETGIDVCIDCHFQGASHPVGMTGKGETIIPKNLPTAEGGIMTCATCHAPHGSKFEYLARIDFSKELCTMCHKGKFF